MSNWNLIFIIISVILSWWLPSNFAGAEPVEDPDVERFTADAGPYAGETWETSLDDWLFYFRDDSWNHHYNIHVDQYGDKYISGYFSGIKDFDPGVEELLIEASGEDDAYILKFDGEGDLEWVQTWEDAGVGLISGVAFDSDSNIFITGIFQETVDLDPGEGSFVRESRGMQDACLIKLNRDGEFEWATTWGNRGWNDATGLTVDLAGNIYVISLIWGGFDYISTEGGIRRITMGRGKSCLLKIDDDGYLADVYRWHACEPKDVAVDSEGSIYIAGDFGLGSAPDFGLGMVDFDPGPGDVEREPLSSFNGYLLKLDSRGEYEWVRTWVVPDVMYVFGVAVDNDGNIYIVGELSNGVWLDLESSITMFHTDEMYNTYLIKLTSDGAFQWARTWSSNEWLTAERIYADNRGFIYMIGDYTGPIDFDPGTDVAMESPPEDRGAYMIRINSDGILVDLYTWQGRYDSFARG